MKHTAKIVLFIGLQLVIAGLAFLAGWHNGNPGDREQLEFYKAGIEFDNDCIKVMRNDRLSSYQSLVESLQLKGDITNAVTTLNRLIDGEIRNATGWNESSCRVSELPGIQWNNGEEEFKVLLRIAEYRLNHPVDYDYPPGRGSKAPAFLTEVLQCRDRRKANLK